MGLGGERVNLCRKEASVSFPQRAFHTMYNDILEVGPGREAG